MFKHYALYPITTLFFSLLSSLPTFADDLRAIGTHGVMVGKQWVLTTKSAGPSTAIVSRLPYGGQEEITVDAIIKHPSRDVDLQLLHLVKEPQNVKVMWPDNWATVLTDRINVPALDTGGINIRGNNFDKIGFNFDGGMPELYFSDLDLNYRPNKPYRRFYKQVSKNGKNWIYITGSGILNIDGTHLLGIISNSNNAGAIDGLSNPEFVEFISLTEPEFREWINFTIKVYEEGKANQLNVFAQATASLVQLPFGLDLPFPHMVDVADSTGVLIDSSCVLTTANFLKDLAGATIRLAEETRVVAQTIPLQGHNLQLLFFEQPVVSLPPAIRQRSTLASLSQKNLLFGLVNVMRGASFYTKLRLPESNPSDKFFVERLYGYSPAGSGIFELQGDLSSGGTISQFKLAGIVTYVSGRSDTEKHLQEVVLLTPERNTEIDNEIIKWALRASPEEQRQREEEARRIEEQRRQETEERERLHREEEERQRIGAEEARLRDEQQRLEEERRKAEEQLRLAEEEERRQKELEEARRCREERERKARGRAALTPVLPAPKFEAVEGNKAIARTGTLIDSRWLLTAKQVGYQIGHQIAALNNVVVEDVIDVPESKFRLVYLASPVVDIPPIARYRPELSVGLELKFVKQEGLNPPTLKNMTIRRKSDIARPDALAFTQTAGNTAFLGSGLFVPVEGKAFIMGIVYNLKKSMSDVTTVETYQLTQQANVFIDNQIIARALLY